MSTKKRKRYSREFKLEAVRLITDKGYSIACGSRGLPESRALTRLPVYRKRMGNPQNAFPGKGQLKAADQELRALQRELERVKEERDILKKALAYFAEDQK